TERGFGAFPTPPAAEPAFWSAYFFVAVHVIQPRSALRRLKIVTGVRLPQSRNARNAPEGASRRPGACGRHGPGWGRGHVHPPRCRAPPKLATLAQGFAGFPCSFGASARACCFLAWPGEVRLGAWARLR